MAGYEFFPEEVRRTIPPLYAQENVADPIAYVKFFTPDGGWTWFAMEFDGEDRFFGLVCGFYQELGYFSLKELKTTKGHLGLHIERDIHWGPKPLSECKKECEQMGVKQ